MVMERQELHRKKEENGVIMMRDEDCWSSPGENMSLALMR